MKILVVCTVEFGLNGVASVIMNYFRLFSKKIQFDFLVHRNAEDCLVNEIRRSGSTINIIDRKKNIFLYLQKLNEMLKNNNYDAIHVHGNSATMAMELTLAKSRGVKKRIAHCHNTKCGHKIIHFILYPMFRSAYTHALACSEEAGKWIYKNSEYIVIENGIDVDKYRFRKEIREKKRKELGLENKFVIGHVGLLNRQKNHKKLFEIFLEFKKIYSNSVLLCVAGDKVIPEKTNEDIKRLGIKKNIIILLTRNDVDELLQAMDFFVFPSRWEGLGMAAIEAQASGLYCLASDRVLNKIDVTPYCSHLKLEESAEVWCREIIRNMNRKINRSEMNKMVKKSEFNIIKCKETLMNIYEEQEFEKW